MTKEKLISDICWNPISDAVSKSIKKSLNDFFSQNVVIPRGENRHPYADVWHEIVEGADFQTYKDSTDEWKNDTWLSSVPVRIKPSEPVYLYKFTYQDYDGAVGISDYLSEEDAIISLVDVNNVSKIEWTKKEKQ